MINSKDKEECVRECQVRDFYALQLNKERPDEILITTEKRYKGSLLRADMRTVDKYQTLREWEFKIFADHKALGQLQRYVAYVIRQHKNSRRVFGVLAAFEFEKDLAQTIATLNLAYIELVVIPHWMSKAGSIPIIPNKLPPLIDIPKVQSSNLNNVSST